MTTERDRKREAEAVRKMERTQLNERLHFLITELKLSIEELEDEDAESLKVRLDTLWNEWEPTVETFDCKHCEESVPMTQKTTVGVEVGDKWDHGTEYYNVCRDCEDGFRDSVKEAEDRGRMGDRMYDHVSRGVHPKDFM